MISSIITAANRCHPPRLAKTQASVWAILWFALAAASTSAPALAQTCPGNSGEPLPATQAEKSALARRLAELEAACSNDAGFLAWYGALLGSQQQPAQAALLLERALMLDPDHAGARADYSDVLAQLGDREAARTLLDDLLRRPDLPDHLDAPFRRRLVQLSQTLWSLGGSLTLRAGHETNLNNAPASDRLEITLPQGRIELEIADSHKTRPGQSTLLEGSLYVERPLPAGASLRMLADGKFRHSPTAPSSDYGQAEAVVQLEIPTDLGDFGINTGASLFYYDNNLIYQAIRGSLNLQENTGYCRLQGGTEAEARHYPANPSLDGRFGSFTASLGCNLGNGVGRLTLRSGKDVATAADRPGGDSFRHELGLLLAHPWGSGIIQGSAQYSHQKDSEGYSALLADGALRRLKRLSIRMDYSHPLDRHWEMLASLESSRQRSNIELFSINNQALWLGLRWNYR